MTIPKITNRNKLNKAPVINKREREREREGQIEHKKYSPAIATINIFLDSEQKQNNPFKSVKILQIHKNQCCNN